MKNLLLKWSASGYRNNNNGTLNDVGDNGNYWSAGAANENNASQLNFNSGNVNPLNNNNRSYGFSVRPAALGLDDDNNDFIMTYETIYRKVAQAYLDARKNERNKKAQLEFEAYLTENLHKLATEIYNRTWKPSPLISFMVIKPTPREIFAPNFRDEVVSHFLFNEIEPILEKKFIRDTYSCRKGKGTLDGINRFIHHIKSETNNYKQEAYVLNLDISGYFMSIDKIILKFILYKHLVVHKDFDTIVKPLIDTILDRNPLINCVKIGDLSLWALLPPNKSLYNSPPGVGLIIGDVISQLFSNIYLNELDQYCKRELKCVHYCRYVDDIRIISKDRKYLESIISKITEFLSTKLHLTLHPKKTKILSTNRNLEFLGASINKYRIHATRRTVKNFRDYVQGIDYRRIVPENELSHINSYLGYFSHFNEYKLVKKIIDDSWLHIFFNFTPDYKKATIKKQMRRVIFKLPSLRKKVILVSGLTRVFLEPIYIYRRNNKGELVTEYETPYVDLYDKPSLDSIFFNLLWQVYKPRQVDRLMKQKKKDKDFIDYVNLCYKLSKTWNT